MLGRFADTVAQHGEAADLIHGRPALHAVAQRLDHHLGIGGKVVGHLARAPGAVAVFQHLGAVPVEQGHLGFDSVFVQTVQEPLVEVEAPLIHRPRAIGQDARPRDRKAVMRNPQARHEGDIGLESVVVIIGDIAVFPRTNPARRLGEGIPDTGGTAIQIMGPLDLVGGGGGTPAEARGERIGRGEHGAPGGWGLIFVYTIF